MGPTLDSDARPGSYGGVPLSAPAAEHNTRAYHWHLEIFPRFTTLGGFELGSAIYINIADPEDAAGYLRESEGGVGVKAV